MPGALSNLLLASLRGAQRALLRAWEQVRALAARAVALLRRAAGSAPIVRGLRATVSFLRSLLRVALAGGALAALVLGGAWLCFQRVPPASIGVQQAQWGGGIAARDFEPGLHFGLRGLATWHLLDRRTHFAFFGAAEQGADNPPLDLRTKEGNEIVVCALVPYRIVPGEGHLLVRDGLRSTYANLARATIQDVLMQDLASLTTEDFASTDVRLARTQATLPRLNELLARYHVRAETIQIHQVDFHDAYEQVLQKKQLTRQLALLAKAGTLVEQEMRANQLEQDTAASEMRIRGEQDKELETLRSKEKLELLRIRSEAQALDFQRRSEAQTLADRMALEGDRALIEAHALKERLTRAAYDSPGGRIELALRNAENLRFREVVLNANDPAVPMLLDVGKWTAMLLGKPER